MKPAFSVIFLTTLIGAGQGLFLAQFGAEMLVFFSLQTDGATHSELLAGAIISLGLLVLGLFASFFHLGHPERAWRAAAMWRTSWLSREVIALPSTMASIFCYALVLYARPDAVAITLASGKDIPLFIAIGGFACITIFALFICTSMIYACLKFLRQWHSPLTVCNFFLMGSASGCTMAAVVGLYFGSGNTRFYLGCAVFFTLLAGVSRWCSLIRNKRLRSASTLQSATGIHHPTIRQMAQGAMGGSFNTRAFIHTYTAPIVKLARRYFLTAAFLLPLVLLFLIDPSSDSFGLALAAFLIQYSGLVVERWYFFIEAEHPQNVYYQAIS
ncbi:MAG: DmsC/YnfH family molybdoenzyme membrane anchor subunit [Pseudomonadota bacterium]